MPPRHPYVLLSQHDRRQRARCYIVREIWTSKKDAPFLVRTKPEKNPVPSSLQVSYDHQNRRGGAPSVPWAPLHFAGPTVLPSASTGLCRGPDLHHLGSLCWWDAGRGCEWAWVRGFARCVRVCRCARVCVGVRGCACVLWLCGPLALRPSGSAALWLGALWLGALCAFWLGGPLARRPLARRL